MFLLDLPRFVRDRFALYLQVLCIDENLAYALAYAKKDQRPGRGIPGLRGELSRY